MTSAVVDSGGSVLELSSSGVENQEVRHPMYYISVLFIEINAWINFEFNGEQVFESRNVQCMRLYMYVMCPHVIRQ